MTLLFFLQLAILGFCMKLVVLLLPFRATSTRWAFIRSPFVSPDMLNRWVPGKQWSKIYSKSLVAIVGIAALYWIYWKAVSRFELHGIVLSYLAVPILLLMGQPLVDLTSLVWLPTGRILPSVHNSPLRSAGLAEFWGRRWNLWFSCWFRFAIFDPMRSRPGLALVTVFFVSGLMHEWVINLPLYWVTGRNLFGSMMIYFLIQAPAVIFENKFLKQRPVARIVLLWVMVVGPVPLLLNEGMLRVLQIWP